MKNQAQVKFPLRSLDVTRFVDSASTQSPNGLDSQDNEDSGGGGDDDNNNEDDNIQGRLENTDTLSRRQRGAAKGMRLDSNSNRVVACTTTKGLDKNTKQGRRVDKQSHKQVYDLFAVVSHHGRGLQEGHFLSYALNPVTQSWLLFNDATVRPVDAETVMSAQPYLLFYRRAES